MAKHWKAGVIGCGSIAQNLHMPGYVKCPNVTLVAGCDPATARHAEAKRIQPDLRMYRDHRAMFKAEELDVVSVASPNCFHAEHAVAALEAGAHVLLEKPAALTMKEIARIRQAVRQSGRRLIVGFSSRFFRGMRKMNRMIRDGAIGEPFMIRIRYAHVGPHPGWAKSPWFYDPKMAGGGALLDMGIHAIDQALWHVGPIRSVQATARTLRKDIKVDDNAVLLLEFANGRALGQIEVGWTTPAGFNGLEIMGDDGWFHFDYEGVLTLTTGKITPNARARVKRRTRIVDSQPRTGGWHTEAVDAVRAFRKNDDLECGIDAGGASLAVALAAYQSSKTGKRVSIASIRKGSGS